MQDVIPPPGGHRPKIGTHATREERRVMEDTGETTAVVDAGAEVDDITAAVEGGAEAASGATVGELGEAALDLATEAPDEATAETEPDDGDPIPDTAIEDKALAEEMAYAEKPFRDAQVEQKDKLTPENQELLDWLASEAAEKAMTKYTEAKGQISEAEAAILERVDKFKTIVEGDRDRFLENDFKFWAPNQPERKESKLAFAETALETVIDMQVAEIMDDSSLSDKEKLEAISGLKEAQNVTRSDLQKSSGFSYPEQPNALAEWRSNDSEAAKVARLWGRVVSSLTMEHGVAAMQTIQEIAQRQGVNAAEVFDRVSSLFSDGLKGSEWKESTNSYIETAAGYIWSETRQKYIKLDA